MIDIALLEIIEQKALIAKQTVGGAWKFSSFDDETGLVSSFGGLLSRDYDGEWDKSAAEHAALCDPNTILEMVHEIKKYRGQK